MKISRPTVLDWIIILAVISIVGVVTYRFRVQRHFDLYGLLVMVTAVVGYLSFRRSPPAKADVSASSRIEKADEKPFNQSPPHNAGAGPADSTVAPPARPVAPPEETDRPQSPRG
jgi:hypothetical protein